MELAADRSAPHLAEAWRTATRSLSPFVVDRIDKETDERMSFQIFHLAPQSSSRLFILNFSVQKAEMTHLMPGPRHVKKKKHSQVTVYHFVIVIISIHWALKWHCAIKIKFQISSPRLHQGDLHLPRPVLHLLRPCSQTHLLFWHLIHFLVSERRHGERW